MESQSGHRKGALGEIPESYSRSVKDTFSSYQGPYLEDRYKKHIESEYGQSNDATKQNALCKSPLDALDQE